MVPLFCFSSPHRTKEMRWLASVFFFLKTPGMTLSPSLLFFFPPPHQEGWYGLHQVIGSDNPPFLVLPFEFRDQRDRRSFLFLFPSLQQDDRIRQSVFSFQIPEYYRPDCFPPPPPSTLERGVDFFLFPNGRGKVSERIFLFFFPSPP